MTDLKQKILKMCYRQHACSIAFRFIEVVVRFNKQHINSSGNTLANTIKMMMNSSITWSLKLPGNTQEKIDLLTTGVSAFAISSSFTLLNSV